jgi:hypothetical protein
MYFSNEQACQVPEIVPLYTTWTSCPFCKAGNRTRSKMCVISGTDILVNSSLCQGVTSESCSTPSCGKFAYLPSPWTDCSKECGGGTRTRTVKCVTVASLEEASSESCKDLEILADSQTCNAHACGHAWSVSQWSSCNKECGGGTQTRDVICLR